MQVNFSIGSIIAHLHTISFYQSYAICFCLLLFEIYWSFWFYTLFCAFTLSITGKTLFIWFIHVSYTEHSIFAKYNNSNLFVYYSISTLVLIHFGQSLAIRFRITSFEEQFTLPFYSITNANTEMYVYKFLSSSLNDSCLFISINIILWLIFTWMKHYYASISNYYYPYCVVSLSASVTI